MSGLPCAKQIIDQLAFLNAASRCAEQATWLRTHADAPPLTDAELQVIRQLLSEAGKVIEEAGKVIGKPFAMR